MAAPASASASAIEAGHNVGPYTLTREIGKGSFAVVFQGKVRATPSAFDATGDDSVEDVGGSQQSSLAAAAAVATSPVTRVAIKIVTRKKLTAKLLDNLEGEISILRTVRHVNIVELIDCLKTSSHIYLVMQYCRMGDLSNWIRSRRRTETSSSQPRRPDPFEREVDLRYPSPHDGGLHADVTRSFLAQLASALQFMRGKNIVHRDIKPQNLLLQEPESEILAFGHPAFIPQLKVADFGFARHLEAASLAETLCGSPLYMAPEILRYEKYDAKADLWSVGAVLFEMSVGKPPFKATNHVELLRKIERGEDKIKFPDERSDDSLRREQARKNNDDVRDVGEIVRPHTVDEDVKRLIRTLLRRRPIERLSFDDFFLSDVLIGYKRKTDAAIEASLSVPSPLHGLSRFSSPSSSSITPIARRVAPAAPSQTAPAPAPAPVSPAVDSHAVSPTTPSVHPSSTSPADATIPPASPSPINAAARHYFAPKYVVGGARKSASVSVRTVESAPPAVVAEQAPPRPTLSTPSAARLAGVDANEGDASSLEDNVLETPGSSVTHLPSSASRATTVTPSSNNAGVGGASSSAAASLKESRRSSGNDDDRGYVMVEKRNVEVNALAEEMANKGKIKSIGWSPLGVVRRPSQLGRLASMSPLSALSGAAHYAVSSSQPQQPSQVSTGSPRISPVMTPSKQVQGFAAASAAGSASPTFAPTSRNSPTTVSPLQARFGSTPPNAPFAVPPGARKPSFSRRTSNNTEGARLAAVAAAQQMSPRPSSLPLVASSAPVDSAMALVGGQSASSASPPSSTLARAISMASVRLFGVPTGMSMRGAGIRRSLRMGLGPGTLLSSSPGQMFDAPLAVAAGNDVAEQNLLSLLHEYGQKSFVLSAFADARLGAYFAEGPHQNSHVVDDTKRRTSSSNSLSGAGGGNSSSIGSTTNAATASAQIAACEAYVLYVRSLSFLQRALDAARDYVEARTLGAVGSRYSVQHAASSSSLLSTTATGGGGGGGASQDVTDAVRWLRAKFHDGVDRANFARSKSGEDLPESAQYIDKMIFDQALEIARGAAMEELDYASRSSDDAAAAATARNSTPVASQWNVERCLLAYETACTMLQGLLDPDEAVTVKDLSASAVGTIEKFVVSITKRMLSIQRKYQGTSAAIMA